MDDDLPPTPTRCLGLAVLVIAFMLAAGIGCSFLWLSGGSSTGLDVVGAGIMAMIAVAMLIESILPIALPILVVLGIIWWQGRWTPPSSHGR